MTRNSLKTLVMAIALAAPAAALIGPAPVAQATSLAPLTVEQLTDASHYVVRGEITDTWTEVDDDGRIWSRARMKVTTVLKGVDVPDEVVIDSLGGTYGGQTLRVEAQAEFSKYEEAIVFLHKNKAGRLSPVGMFLGKYTIRRAPDTNRQYARTWHPVDGQAFDARFLPHPPEEKRVYLETLLDRVETRLDTGWDGQPIPGIAPTELAQINTVEWRKR